MTLSPESRAWLHVPPVLSVRAAGGFMRRLGQMKTWCVWEAATVATPSSIFTNWSCCVATIANLTLTYASMLSCWKKNGAPICFAMLRFWWRECEMWIYPADLRNISPIKPKMVSFYFDLFIFLHYIATCTICYLYFKDFFEKKHLQWTVTWWKTMYKPSQPIHRALTPHKLHKSFAPTRCQRSLSDDGNDVFRQAGHVKPTARCRRCRSDLKWS